MNSVPPPEARGPRVVVDRLDILQAYDVDGRDVGCAVRFPMTDNWLIYNEYNDEQGGTCGEDQARELLWQLANVSSRSTPRESGDCRAAVPWAVAKNGDAPKTGSRE
jgi:hypothetical protein